MSDDSQDSIRRAEPGDVPAILALLRECKLPVDGVPEDAALLLVAERGRRVVGVAGLERHGADGLLRSVAVSPSARGRRIASRLCDEIERAAPSLGIGRLYLLTETAETFFLERGYHREERARAPAGIAGSRELSAVCPASAVLMQRAL